MIIFTLIISSLIALALIFILPTLLRRHSNISNENNNPANTALFQQQLEELNQDLAAGILDPTQYTMARYDLERTFLHDINNSQQLNSPKTGYWAAPLLAITVPVLSIAIYLLTGNYQTITNLNNYSQIPNANTNELPPMETLVKRLAERMQTRPDDLPGWIMLGRSAMSLDQKQLAADAYAQALRLSPQEIDILLDYADVLSQIAEEFTGKPLELITTALNINPKYPRTLWMMGLAHFQNSDYNKAINYWLQLQSQLPIETKEATTLNNLITEAQHRKEIQLPLIKGQE